MNVKWYKHVVRLVVYKRSSYCVILYLEYFYCTSNLNILYVWKPVSSLSIINYTLKGKNKLSYYISNNKTLVLKNKGLSFYIYCLCTLLPQSTFLYFNEYLNSFYRSQQSQKFKWHILVPNNFAKKARLVLALVCFRLENSPTLSQIDYGK